MKYTTHKLEELEYLVSYPENFDENEKYPVIILFHGAGSRGKKVEEFENYTGYENIKDFPFVTVTPVCHLDTWYDLMHLLKRLVNEVADFSYVDSKRIYIMGNSMGGYATWQLAMSVPEMIAAIVPICGGGMYWNAGRLKNVPVWAFHGKKDEVVFVEESEKMVKAVNDAGGNAKLTVYPDAMHNSWSETFANIEVYNWLLSNKLDDK